MLFPAKIAALASEFVLNNTNNVSQALPRGQIIGAEILILRIILLWIFVIKAFLSIRSILKFNTEKIISCAENQTSGRIKVTPVIT